MKTFFLSLLTILLPFAANADAVEIDGIYYHLYEDTKEAAVTWNPREFYSGDLVIPTSVNYEETEYQVTSIDQQTFVNCNDLTSLVIPNSVKSIGWRTFYCCSNLTSITLPSSLKSIDDYLFYGCSSLTSITIPNSVKSIGGYSFCQCRSLTSITIPDGVTKIGEYTFYGCNQLASVSLPGSVRSFEECAFALCIALTAVTIPDGVTYIGDHAFTVCGLTSLVIPNSVSRIDRGAFDHCEYLATLTIGCEVWSISDKAFSRCPALTDVYCHPESVPSTKGDAFQDSNIENATLHVPANSLEAYKAVEPWMYFKEIVPLDGQSIETLEYSSPAAPISIYTTDGKLLESATGQNDAAAIINHLPSGTTAIIKMGDKSVKVMKR